MINRKEIKFLINQIIIDGSSVVVSDFDAIKNDDLQTDDIKNTTGKMEILSIKKVSKKIEENRFVLIQIEEGDRYPYSSKVVDSDLNEIDNPRSPDEIELKDQFFALVDTKTSRIFLSDIRKKALFVKWIQQKIQKPVEIKPLIEEQEFIDTLRSVEEICLTAEPNILNSTESATLASVLVDDIYGFGAQEATLRLTYSKEKSFTGKIQSLIKGIIDNRVQYKNITVIGRNSDKFETIFNINSVISKVSILVLPDESTQKINGDLLFAELILKIKDNDKK